MPSANHSRPAAHAVSSANCEAMSSSVLRQRLTELLDARLVTQQPDTSYTLTELGQGVYRALRPLIRWSGQWASTMAEDGEA